MHFFLLRAIQNYGEQYTQGTGEFEIYAFFRALGDFVSIFMLSLLIGASMGCFTALISFLNKLFYFQFFLTYFIGILNLYISKIRFSITPSTLDQVYPGT